MIVVAPKLKTKLRCTYSFSFSFSSRLDSCSLGTLRSRDAGDWTRWRFYGSSMLCAAARYSWKNYCSRRGNTIGACRGEARGRRINSPSNGLKGDPLRLRYAAIWWVRYARSIHHIAQENFSTPPLPAFTGTMSQGYVDVVESNPFSGIIRMQIAFVGDHLSNHCTISILHFVIRTTKGELTAPTLQAAALDGPRHEFSADAACLAFRRDRYSNQLHYCARKLNAEWWMQC